MLDDTELQQVQNIDVDGDQVLLHHTIPGLEGDFLQRLNRRASVIRLSGVLAGATARDDLKTLRAKYRAGDPLSFVADITTATRVGEVLIQELNVRELAGKPQRFEYAFLLREYVVAAPPEGTTRVDNQAVEQGSQIHDDQVEDIANNAGALEVHVSLEEGNDFSTIVVYVEGEATNGEPFLRESQQQQDGVYRFEDIPAGDYTVKVGLR